MWADFRGGKGVATLFGLVVGISPWTALSCAGVFLLVLFLTRFVSLSSILASIAFRFLSWLFSMWTMKYIAYLLLPWR
ncbi:MAG: glycerol-3-phosphate acyltransferase [Bacteroidota bacterium]